MNDITTPTPTHSLTAEERVAMKREFVSFMEANPLPLVQQKQRASILSPYFTHFVRVPAFAVLALMIMGGTAYGAEQSLPTDFLYPIKANVLEPIFIEAPARTSLTKAHANQKLVERRLEEALALVEQDEMDAEASSIIVAALEEHTNAVHAFVAEARLAGNFSDALAVGTELENTLEAQGDALESISDKDEPATATVIALIEEVADQAEEAEDIGENIEQQAASTTTSETSEYLNETAEATEKSINTLRAKINELPSDRSQELVRDAIGLLENSSAAYTLGTTHVLEGNTELALPELRNALKNAKQGLILLDSYSEYGI